MIAGRIRHDSIPRHNQPVEISKSMGVERVRVLNRYLPSTAICNGFDLLRQEACSVKIEFIKYVPLGFVHVWESAGWVVTPILNDTHHALLRRLNSCRAEPPPALPRQMLLEQFERRSRLARAPSGSSRTGQLKSSSVLNCRGKSNKKRLLRRGRSSFDRHHAPPAAAAPSPRAHPAR